MKCLYSRLVCTDLSHEEVTSNLNPPANLSAVLKNRLALRPLPDVTTRMVGLVHVCMYNRARIVLSVLPLMCVTSTTCSCARVDYGTPFYIHTYDVASMLDL